MNTSNEEFYSTDSVVCPYCKDEIKDAFEQMYDEKTESMDCDSCGKSFPVRVYAQWSWTTWKQENDV